ncbi:exported protein (hyp9) [Plasmodium reichenowi]|uniref:Exported protein (Hyp9) n=1 Tax=Plasmodium reichenowi TaxID=5854 RepID=A0A151LN48_PLARE|nr:exported protein (hyp9) [Plasmodium reichenowi]KYO00615.1 exported protein (hyp9) [Plasmodium reichenowi]
MFVLLYKFFLLSLFVINLIYVDNGVFNKYSYEPNDGDYSFCIRISRLLSQNNKELRKPFFNKLKNDIKNYNDIHNFRNIDKECKVVDVNSVKTREGMNDVTVTMKSALKPDLITISVTNKWVTVNEWDYLMNDLCKENNIEIEDGNVKKRKKPVKYVVRVLGYIVIIPFVIVSLPFIAMVGLGRCMCHSKEKGANVFKNVWNALF